MKESSISRGPTGTASSFGEELRRERELRSIELREVAEATKVNIRYLEAMERNDFAHLPGGLFNRGFVRAYAQYIGVDPEAMVNAYLLEEQSQRGELGSGIDGVLRRRRPPAEAPATDDKRPRSRPAPWLLWLVGVALLVALAAIAWFSGFFASGGSGG